MIFDSELFDATIFDAGSGGEATSDQSDTHDGVAGSSLIVYKRPHKKLHDEIEEYFARLTETEAADVVREARELQVNEGARAAVAESLHDRAVQAVAAILEEERNAELRAFLALAQDEEDSVIVLVMLGTVH